MITPYFIGDVVLAADATVRVADSAGNDSGNISLAAGSWFAHPGSCWNT